MIAEALRKEQGSESEIFGHLMVSIDEMSHASDLEHMSFLLPLLFYLATVLFAVLSVLRLSL